MSIEHTNGQDRIEEGDCILEERARELFDGKRQRNLRYPKNSIPELDVKHPFIPTILMSMKDED